MNTVEPPPEKYSVEALEQWRILADHRAMREYLERQEDFYSRNYEWIDWAAITVGLVALVSFAWWVSKHMGGM